MLQLPMFEPKTEWAPPSLSSLPSWADAKRVAIDIETKDLRLKELGPGVRRGAYIVGVSFAIEDGPAHYLPIAHAGGGNLDREQVLQYLRDQARVFKGDLVGANLPYDLDFLQEEGVIFSPRYYRDVQVAEPLLDELQLSYSLDAIALRHKLPGKDESHLHAAAQSWGVDPKAGLWQLPARHVGLYAIQDVRLPLQLLRRQETQIEEQELWPIYNLESQVLPVLLKLRRRGVRVDWDRLAQVETFSLGEEGKVLDEVFRLTGIRVAVGDVWKADALAKVLVSIGVEPPKTPSTNKPSVTADLLKAIDHDVARCILRARKVNKLRTTFAQSVRDHAIGDRVHTSYRQVRSNNQEGEDDDGARYGRLSSCDPNLQQQPARDPELGPLWRSIYIPDEDGLWACLDYSQQEPRWATHFAELAKCTGAREAADKFRNDPRTDNHEMMRDIIGWKGKEGRTRAKEIYLGLCYGMGGAKLCRKINLPTKWVHSSRQNKMIEVAGDEGNAVLDAFNRGAPFIKELAEKCTGAAKARGYVRTVLGRKCRFPKGPKGYDFTHKACNRVVQGSSGDQTKKALVDADAAGCYVQLQVHDELDTTIWKREEAEMLAEIMRTGVPCNVPSVVDIETGDSWGEVK